MSKSKGNVIYPEVLIDKYGLDATKYFLMRAIPVSQDGVFTPEEFVERFNIDLCNDLGNLVNRTVGMINKYYGGIIPNYSGDKNDQDKDLEDVTVNQKKEFENKMEELQFSNSLGEIWTIISRCNKYIDETTPWILAKEDNKEKLGSVMYHLVQSIRFVAVLLQPFMPETAESIFEQLGINKPELKTWDSIQKYHTSFESAKVIETGKPLFVRLDKDAEIEYIKNEMQK